MGRPAKSNMVLARFCNPSNTMGNKSMIDSLGGRKFVLTVLAMIICTVFVVLDKMSAEMFVTAILVNSGIFTAGNVTESIRLNS